MLEVYKNRLLADWEKIRMRLKPKITILGGLLRCKNIYKIY